MAVGVLEPELWPIERLRDAVDEVVAIDPSELSDVALADELIGLRRQMDRQEAAFARLAHAGHTAGRRPGRWRRVDCLVPAASGGNARGRREGRDRSGRGVRAPVRDCRRLAVRRDLDRRGAHDRRRPRGGTRRHARRPASRSCSRWPATATCAVCGARPRTSATSPAPTATNPATATASALVPPVRRRTVLSGELGDLAAETVVTALHAYTDPPTAGDTRTTVATSRRRARADLRRRARAPQRRRPAPRPRLGRPRLGHSDRRRASAAPTASSPARSTTTTSTRLLCDCAISRIVTGPDSLPLDVGRTRRTVPPALRRAIVARDEGCRFPGCNKPPGWCDAHHTTHWIHGGRTEINSLILLCDHHHHVVHQPGWNADFDGRDPPRHQARRKRSHLTEADSTGARVALAAQIPTSSSVASAA